MLVKMREENRLKVIDRLLKIEDPDPCVFCGRLVLAGFCCEEAKEQSMKTCMMSDIDRETLTCCTKTEKENV